MMSKLEDELCAILMKRCGERGDNEGAVETLERLIRELDGSTRSALRLAESVDDMMGALRIVRSLDTPPENLRTVAGDALDRLAKRGI
jgi:hypothetical protein